MIAHHWAADRRFDLKDRAYGLVSACGIMTVATRQVPLCGPGNMDFCQRCDTKMLKRKW